MTAISNVSSQSYATMQSPSGSAANGGLQTALAQLKKEHSACVNCGSAATQSGKLNIQKLEIQIASIEVKLGGSYVKQIDAPSSSDIARSTPGRIDLYA
jgi:hypothetical protein